MRVTWMEGQGWDSSPQVASFLLGFLVPGLGGRGQAVTPAPPSPCTSQFQVLSRQGPQRAGQSLGLGFSQLWVPHLCRVWANNTSQVRAGRRAFTEQHALRRCWDLWSTLSP